MLQYHHLGLDNYNKHKNCFLAWIYLCCNQILWTQIHIIHIYINKSSICLSDFCMIKNLFRYILGGGMRVLPELGKVFRMGSVFFVCIWCKVHIISLPRERKKSSKSSKYYCHSISVFQSKKISSKQTLIYFLAFILHNIINPLFFYSLSIAIPPPSPPIKHTSKHPLSILFTSDNNSPAKTAPLTHTRDTPSITATLRAFIPINNSYNGWSSRRVSHAPSRDQTTVVKSPNQEWQQQWYLTTWLLCACGQCIVGPSSAFAFWDVGFW